MAKVYGVQPIPVVKDVYTLLDFLADSKAYEANLNNSGPGSLRQCAEVMTGPRICRIMVAGAPAANDLIINVFYK